MARLEIFEGLIRGLDLMDEVNRVVRASANRPDAVERVIALGFSEVQAQHVLDMPVGRQTEEARSALLEHAKRLSRPGALNGENGP
jgi:DNA gyrase/topoisomerase IV subunit A